MFPYHGCGNALVSKAEAVVWVFNVKLDMFLNLELYSIMLSRKYNVGNVTMRVKCELNSNQYVFYYLTIFEALF